MELLVGKYSGFCKGVNYTYIKTLECLKDGPIYCLGELIHNEHVISELEERGMKTIKSLDEIEDGSKVIFRAHGEAKERYLYAKDHNIEVIDLTCEKVKLIHDKVEQAKDSSFIVIIGKKTHPEIIGTIGFAGNNYLVVESEDDLTSLKEKVKESKFNKVYVISQTTFNSKKFDELVNIIKKILDGYDLILDKSICAATENRQIECDEISKKVDHMIVIGSKNSSNTKELYNISIKNCNNVIFVENIKDLKNYKFNNNSIIGIVAGASTPKSLIDEVINYLKVKYNEN